MQDFVPMKTEHRQELAPWVSPSSSHQIKMLNTLQAQYDRNPKISHLMKIESGQTELSIALAKDQQKFEIELFKQGKISALQKYQKSFSKATQIPAKCILMKKIESERHEAELFNQFFQSVLICSDYKSDCQIRHERLINRFLFSRPEVRDVLLSLDIDKAKVPDRIGKELLRLSTPDFQYNR